MRNTAPNGAVFRRFPITGGLMIFLISLALTAVLIRLCAKSLKAHPVPYYCGAVILAAAVVFCTVQGVAFPGWFSTWVWPIFARSALSTALFVAVMYAAAVPNGSKLMKTVMPIRGELSILASILTLGHNIAYGKTYFRLLFVRPDRLPVNQLLAAVCSLVMLCIMIPLFITSFKCVRRKMKGSSWKKLQRLAYGFYALVYIHVLLLTVPGARKGSGSYLLTVLVYSVVFLTYGALRTRKALRNRSARVRQIPVVAAVLAMVLVLGAAAGPFLRGSGEEADADDPAVEEELGEPEEDAEEDPAPDSEDLTDSEPAEDGEEQPAQPDETGTEDTPAAQQPDAEPSHTTVAEPAAPAQKPTPSTPAVEQPAAPAEPEQTAPAPEPEVTYQYQNGTFSGSGEGFAGTITVSVSIENDRITNITVVSSSDDEPYWSEGKGIISQILSAQSTNVDTVSGATFSSGGIRDAVKAALSRAEN